MASPANIQSATRLSGFTQAGQSGAQHLPYAAAIYWRQTQKTSEPKLEAFTVTRGTSALQDITGAQQVRYDFVSAASRARRSALSRSKFARKALSAFLRAISAFSASLRACSFFASRSSFVGGSFSRVS